MSEKKFPILETNESIDWNLIAPHEKQAMENHGQTLEKLASRHGLSWYELLCVMADKKLLVDIKYDKEKDYEKLCRQVLLLEEVKQYRAIGTRKNAGRRWRSLKQYWLWICQNRAVNVNFCMSFKASRNASS